jgi:hypothetical protein
LVSAYNEYKCFDGVSLSLFLECLKKATRAAIKFCAKLKRKATGTF